MKKLHPKILLKNNLNKTRSVFDDSNTICQNKIKTTKQYKKAS